MRSHIPNMVTSCNLICGCIAVVFAISGKVDISLLFIIIGAIFDFGDGFSARALKVSSPIGKELDSLADVITFGFAPSAIIFNFLFTWSLSSDVCRYHFSLFTLHISFFSKTGLHGLTIQDYSWIHFKIDVFIKATNLASFGMMLNP